MVDSIVLGLHFRCFWTSDEVGDTKIHHPPHIIFIAHLIRGREKRKILAFNGYRVKQKVTYESTPN